MRALSPLDALRSATTVAAGLLRRESELGTLEKGGSPTSWAWKATRSRTSAPSDAWAS
jgi:imidazolonepropionase-like amidohydrolase